MHEPIDIKEVELKPCPFCGCDGPEFKNEQIQDGWEHYDASYIVCPGCGARTMSLITSRYYGIHHRPEEIVESWNRRFYE